MLYRKDSFWLRINRYSTEFFYGFITRFIDLFVPVQQRHWIFGADYGCSYRENTKYLFEYMVEEHPDYVCTFVTNSRNVMDEVKKKGYPCVMNDSLRGILTISKADAVFTAQNPNDIKYAFKKKNRTYYYMTHGQPYKKCREALPKDFFGKDNSLLVRIRRKLSNLFCVDYEMKDVSFVPATSEFLAPYLAMVIGNDVPVKVLGMPKNDRKNDKKAMDKERWIDGTEGKTIITYMPTHRQYGMGEVTPTPFEHDIEAQEWLREHNIIFIMKQHPNMITKLNNPINNDVIKDITTLKLDPAVVMYHSDILISDYSSAFLEFMWFRRPLLFYIYDNYADVEGALYDITGDFPNSFCFTENELFEKIKKCVSTPINYVPSDATMLKYFNSTENNASEQYFVTVRDEKYS